jgi:hypothetical protein
MQGQFRVGAAVAAVAIGTIAAITLGAVAADRVMGAGTVTGTGLVARTTNPVATSAPGAAPSSAGTRHQPASATTERPRPTLGTPRPTSAARTSIKPPAGVTAAGLQRSATAAASYATGHGYQVAIAVLDSQTGTVTTAGDADAGFASESVVKTFIAARLLATGQMTGGVADTAWKMITQSDDASANALYGLAGGDGVVNWAASHFRVANLGGPPLREGWWGGTRITASGLVRFYAAAKRDPVIGNWLFDAMHHTAAHGSDGFDQQFGIAAVAPGSAVKQGWGFDYGDGSASLNSTGLVGGDRYAVAILLRGERRSYPTTMQTTLTETARTLMPGGRIPSR